MNFAKFRYMAGAAAVAGIVAGVAMSVQAASNTGNATATVIAPITIAAAATDLAFGNVVPDTGATGTVLVTPAGARTCSGNLTCTGTTTGADFAVAGESGATYAITLPGSATVTAPGPETMTVDTFTSTPSGTGTLTGGNETLFVGATLQVGTGQAVGAYTGTYTVTVDYN